MTRVVADCAAAPHTLRARPQGIVIACGDGGLGVKKMAWNNWGTGTATGRGILYENLCEPNCAQGKFGTYPVLVRLSGIKSSSQGAYFSELAVTWEDGKPSNRTPSRFGLAGPGRFLP